ncbi:MAG: bifunctional YncE family protein/alkaline phosphatase family protein [Proteobacteria bacterium]|nr:bifunctional YncE family protein/alkaline phosphatase family protein [Pseudomonadota bacterium]
MVIISVLSACGGGGGEKIISPTDEALRPAGRLSDGSILIPGGWRVSPPGTQFKLGSFPMNIILSPDGKKAVVTNNGFGLMEYAERPTGPATLPDYKEYERVFEFRPKDQSLTVLDLEQGRVIQDVWAHAYPGSATNEAFFLGLAVDPAGTRLYASGGQSQKILVYDWQNAGLVINRVIPLRGFPGGLVLSPDGNTLYVAENLGNKVAVVDLTTDSIRAEIPAGSYPYWLTLSPDGGMLYVSNWGPPALWESSLVWMIDTGSLDVVKMIEVGKNAEGMAVTSDGGELYVANSDTDDISVIDTVLGEVTETISLRDAPDLPMGIYPTHLSLSPDETRLYVSCSGENTVRVISRPGHELAGVIPAGWYPTATAVSPDNQSLYIVNAKGEGAGPNPNFEYIGGLIRGTLSRVETPDRESLAIYTDIARENNRRPSGFFSDAAVKTGHSPIPSEPGEFSALKYVFFIMKENKTYDQVFGDLEGADGDPDLCIFGEEYTPNQHQLAREFTNLDNFFSNAEVSVQGHIWNTALTITDYNEKTWMAGYRDQSRIAASGIEAASYPWAGFIFNQLLNSGVGFRDYGQVVGIVGELRLFARYWDGRPWEMGRKDMEKIIPIINDIQKGKVEPFTYILLPNDHTYGITPGKPTPESMVADNDEATGKLVEAITNSPYWKKSVIFITEDDPQSGADHVDAHRTICLVISPYSRRGFVSRTHYSFSSIHRTIELILGLNPLSRSDAGAPPMYDCFTSQPDLTPFQAVPRRIPEGVTQSLDQMKPDLKAMARECQKMNWDIPDQVDIGRILYKVMKGKNQKKNGG